MAVVFGASLTALILILDFVSGHENAYVRTSSAAAIADAVELHPQTGHETIDALQALYREKVGRCRFVFALVVSVC